VHEAVDEMIEHGLRSGAVGGKLVGAGGGGFLLFYADSKTELRLGMAERGLEEVRFSFDYEGSKVLVT
jgi:D-glycero-alpha-D-manno-heptose-7-phosphate kinase